MHVIAGLVLLVVFFGVLSAMWHSAGGRKYAVAILIVVGSLVVGWLNEAAGTVALWAGMICFGAYLLLTSSLVRRFLGNMAEQQEQAAEALRRQQEDEARRQRVSAIVSAREAERNVEEAGYAEKRLGLLLSTLWQHCALLDGSASDAATLQAMNPALDGLEKLHDSSPQVFGRQLARLGEAVRLIAGHGHESSATAARLRLLSGTA